MSPVSPFDVLGRECRQRSLEAAHAVHRWYEQGSDASWEMVLATEEAFREAVTKVDAAWRERRVRAASARVVEPSPRDETWVRGFNEEARSS